MIKWILDVCKLDVVDGFWFYFWGNIFGEVVMVVE